MVSRQVYWNAFIRYAFISSLKVQVAAVSTLAVYYFTEHSADESFFTPVTIFASAILGVFNVLIPMIFWCML
jgi:hypothetical protein